MRYVGRIMRVLGSLLILLLFAPACSSTHAAADAGNGTGGSGGIYGDAGNDAASDTGPHGTPFSCGDASCVTGATYCRVVSSPGGNTGTNNFNTILSYDCPPLNSGCPAHDCSCVTMHQGFFDCLNCNDDGGAVVATCDKI